MLKDKLAKFLDNSKKQKDPMNINIMDGFVDIKAYKVSDDGNKKMIYHDCGDNVVTDWMRHAIMMLLTGFSFSDKGNILPSDIKSSENSRQSDQAASMFSLDPTHRSKGNDKGKNYDGYLINGEQYFWGESDSPLKYSESAFQNKGYKYAIFPTKVLLGTGVEYPSWEILRSENETVNASWYQDMLNRFGGDETVAMSNFNDNISLPCNGFSGSISTGIHSGPGSLTQMRTVNDPRTSTKVETSAALMNKNYNVTGAIKTIYFDEAADVNYLQSTITDGGKLLRPANEGIGRPAFIYFTTPVEKGEDSVGRVPKEGWSDATSDVSLSKDNSSDYLNKITFKIVMPSQSAGNDSVGKYYPYNGFTLRQMGLYNDAKIAVKKEDVGTELQENMRWGMLLAVKNIVSLDKTADVELVMTWTLTI